MRYEATPRRRLRRPLLFLLLGGLAACAAQPVRPGGATGTGDVRGVMVVPPAPSVDAEFDIWLETFKTEAVAAGISRRTVDRAFVGVTPNDRVVELDRKQPEGRITFARYFENTVSDVRIRKGRALLAEHRALLDRVAATYGVPAKVVVALWGVETSFGANTGGFSVVRSLATLAYEGRRASFFRGELKDVLRIMEAEGFGPEKMIGSWAGAMGQCQFMPSSYLKWAVDFDSDGHRDIWATKADVFGSAANYLKQNGWIAGDGWGRPVRPPRLAKELIGLEVKKTLAEWQALGVRQPDGSDLPAAEMTASLINPGEEGRYWLVYNNFRTIMHWNRSTYFALSVLQLADAIGQ